MLPRNLTCLLTAILVSVIVLFACAPVADAGRDYIERPDGAMILFVSDGVNFMPGAERALGVVLVLNGDELTSTDERCEPVAERSLACRLGSVEETEFVQATGLDVIVNATFRRVGSTSVYLVFGR